MYLCGTRVVEGVFFFSIPTHATHSLTSTLQLLLIYNRYNDSIKLIFTDFLLSFSYFAEKS